MELAMEKLEECLGEWDRDWRKCQKEVLDLKRCQELSQPNATPNQSINNQQFYDHTKL
jgi:hypothetical protein